MNSRKLILLVFAICLILGSMPLAAQDDQINMTMWVRNISFQTQELVDTWNANNDSQVELTVIPNLSPRWAPPSPPENHPISPVLI